MKDFPQLVMRYLEQEEKINEIAARVLRKHTRGRICRMNQPGGRMFKGIDNIKITEAQMNELWTPEEERILDVAAGVYGIGNIQPIEERQ